LLLLGCRLLGCRLLGCRLLGGLPRLLGCRLLGGLLRLLGCTLRGGLLRRRRLLLLLRLLLLQQKSNAALHSFGFLIEPCNICQAACHCCCNHTHLQRLQPLLHSCEFVLGCTMPLVLC